MTSSRTGGTLGTQISTSKKCSIVGTYNSTAVVPSVLICYETPGIAGDGTLAVIPITDFKAT